MARRKPKKTSILRLLAISLALALLIVVAYPVGIYIDILRVRWRLPVLIPKAAAAHRLDPLLVKSIVIEESGMNYRARSKKGAVGLMQIMPIVLEDYQKGTGRAIMPNVLRDPEINLEVGCWYLAHLLQIFHEQREPVYFALAAYNAGATNVERWIGGAKGLTGEEFLLRIRFKGTRRYVASIIHRWARLMQQTANSSLLADKRTARARLRIAPQATPMRREARRFDNEDGFRGRGGVAYVASGFSSGRGPRDKNMAEKSC